MKIVFLILALCETLRLFLGLFRFEPVRFLMGR